MRVTHQASEHWTEFALIVVSGNLIVTLGTVVKFPQTTLDHSLIPVAVAMTVASALATVLAYYSIQAGAAAVIQPLLLGHVATSFVVAAAQVGLSMATYQLVAHPPEGTAAQLATAHHWLPVFSVFAWCGAAASWTSTRSRRHWRATGPDVALRRYERLQLEDRLAACVAGVVVVGVWTVTWNSRTVWSVLVPILIAAVGMAIGLHNQQRAILTLWSWVHGSQPHPISNHQRGDQNDVR